MQHEKELSGKHDNVHGRFWGSLPELFSAKPPSTTSLGYPDLGRSQTTQPPTSSLHEEQIKANAGSFPKTRRPADAAPGRDDSNVHTDPRGLQRSSPCLKRKLKDPASSAPSPPVSGQTTFRTIEDLNSEDRHFLGLTKRHRLLGPDVLRVARDSDTDSETASQSSYATAHQEPDYSVPSSGETNTMSTLQPSSTPTNEPTSIPSSLAIAPPLTPTEKPQKNGATRKYKHKSRKDLLLSVYEKRIQHLEKAIVNEREQSAEGFRIICKLRRELDVREEDIVTLKKAA